jgi:hypothetical protein
MFLDCYSKNRVAAQESEGTAFAQKTKGKKAKSSKYSDKKESYDKDYYKD